MGLNLFFIITFLNALPVSAQNKDLSNQVNSHLKEVQWKMDFERDVRSVEAMPTSPVPTAPKRKHVPAQSFGVLTHEENIHFDTRSSFEPKSEPSIGNNLNAWADDNVNALKENRRMNTAKQIEWMNILKANANRHGYDVRIDAKTGQILLVPKATANLEDRKPTSAVGF